MARDYPLGSHRDGLNLRRANDGLGLQIASLAASRGLCVARYVRNYGRSFDGFTFYAVYRNGAYPSPSGKVYAGYTRPRNLRNPRIMVYAQARHARYGEPSIIGEKRALEALSQALQEA